MNVQLTAGLGAGNPPHSRGARAHEVATRWLNPIDIGLRGVLHGESSSWPYNYYTVLYGLS